MDAAKASRNRIRDRCRDFSEIKVSRHRYLAQIGEASVIDYKLPTDHNFDMFLRFKKRQTRNKGLSLKDSKIYDTLKMSKINQTLPTEASNITQEKFNNYREINRKIQEQFERNQTIALQKNSHLVPLIRQKIEIVRQLGQRRISPQVGLVSIMNKIYQRNDVPLKDSNITDLDEYNYSTLKDIQSLQAESYQRKVGKVSQQRHMDRMLRK
ncbi:hypothetical protein pb186bvf_007053 [Paramecium bursaria]